MIPPFLSSKAIYLLLLMCEVETAKTTPIISAMIE